ncbi:MAG: Methyltransferase type 11 [Thermoleophilia bacterium]|nr:Methyltransferase type 11 [Thermoleophilia bacterium]
MTGIGGEAYEALGDLYDAWCAEVAEDLPFYLGLAASLAGELGRDGLDVVELGAGSGRVAVPMAAAGHRVTAIDASTAQLERCRSRAHEYGVAERIRIVEGDMRRVDDLVEPTSADLVLVPFRGLLHVTADRDRVLRGAARVLRPGGAVAFDVFHPDAAQVDETDGRWIHRRAAATSTGRWRFDERATYTAREDLGAGGLGLDVDVRARWRARRRPRRVDPEALPDPLPEAAHEQEARLELGLVPAARWRASLEGAGLGVDGAYGWFDARPLEPDDDDSVWVARRAADD